MSKFGDFIKTKGKIICLGGLIFTSAICAAYDIADLVHFVKGIKSRANTSNCINNDEMIIDAEVIDNN